MPTPPDQTSTATPAQLSGWDEVRRLADELRLEIHLGSMEARDRWERLQPELVALERKVASARSRAGHAISTEIDALRDALRALREHLSRTH